MHSQAKTYEDTCFVLKGIKKRGSKRNLECVGIDTNRTFTFPEYNNSIFLIEDPRLYEDEEEKEFEALSKEIPDSAKRKLRLDSLLGARDIERDKLFQAYKGEMVRALELANMSENPRVSEISTHFCMENAKFLARTGKMIQ
jgi:hypothetical protein